MKKVLSVLVILSVLSFCIFTYADTATSWTAKKASFKVFVRGQEYTSETPPIVVEGRTYLPLRAMGAVLGVSVDWNATLKQAEVGMSTVSKDASANTQTALTAAEKAIWQKGSWKATKASFKVKVLGKEPVFENPPIVVEGRTFLPLKALGTALGINVVWNDTLKQAEVDMGGTVTVPEPTKPAAPVANPTPTSTPTSTPSSAESNNHSNSSGVTPAVTPAVTHHGDTTIKPGLIEVEETPESEITPTATPKVHHGDTTIKPGLVEVEETPEPEITPEATPKIHHGDTTIKPGLVEVEETPAT